MATDRHGNVTIDGLDLVRASLRSSGKTVRRAARLAINDTARKTRTEGSKAIREQVSLKASYVRKHLQLRPANDANLRATITATKRPVLLSRYGAKQLTRKAKQPRRSTGNPRWNIQPGRKSAGVSVKVKAQGPRKKMRSAFFIPLKAGKYHSAGATGVAVRTGPRPDDYRVLHGPSVDQVWRDVREQVSPAAGVNLQRQFIRQLERLL